MSQTRTVDDIRNEYSQLCAKAGHVNYQIFQLSSDLKLINEQLRDLNLEATKLPPAVEEVKTNE